MFLFSLNSPVWQSDDWWPGRNFINKVSNLTTNHVKLFLSRYSKCWNCFYFRNGSYECSHTHTIHCLTLALPNTQTKLLCDDIQIYIPLLRLHIECNVAILVQSSLSQSSATGLYSSADVLVWRIPHSVPARDKKQFMLQNSVGRVILESVHMSVCLSIQIFLWTIPLRFLGWYLFLSDLVYFFI